MRNIVMSSILISLLVVPAFSQQARTPKTKAGKTNASDSGNPTPSRTQPADQPQLGSRLASTVANSVSEPDDHVPCFFTMKQLMDLRPVPSVAKLTEADQSRVLKAVVETVDAANEKELTRTQKERFIEILAGDLDGKLVGKTPGEALATIMDILYKITAANADIAGALALSDPELIRQKTIARANKYGGESFAEAVQKKLDSQNFSWFSPKNPSITSDRLAALVAEVPDELLATKSAASQTIRDAADKTVEDLTNGGSAPQLTGSVVESARTEINKITRPNDIGCAYQILSWNQARLLFGRSVANDFIAVQVTVRNLNAKEEFIVHNAMLSVDADIHGAIGRYFEGADKISVEAYNNAGESLTARGIVGNGISAATTLLSALQPIVNVTNFSNAVAAFNGGVPKGWASLSPDHQKEQLLLIANSGFSATYTTKTVVGKSGAATFYTWFPAKPFLEGWWVQDCARNIVRVKYPRTDPENPSPPSPLPPPPQVGVDLVRARDACRSEAGEWQAVSYQKWSSTSDQLFRELSLAVVAGIHVLEESKNKSSITDLKCPNNPQGEVDFSKATSDGTISCDVSGDNLDKVAKLRLENASNAVDPIRPEATVTVSGDNTAAKAAFKLSDLVSAGGDAYNVYAVGKDGAETATGQKISLDSKTVTLTAIKPDTIDLGNRPDKITLTGYHLDKLGNVCLSQGPAAGGQTVKVSVDNATQATVSAGSLNISQGTWHIYLDDCTKQPTDSGRVLTVSGVAAPAIDSFSPTSAAVGGTVTINGSSLTGATDVTFGGVTAHSTSVTDKKITVIVPSGAVSGPVGVTTPGGTTTAKGSFRVLPKAKERVGSKATTPTPK